MRTATDSTYYFSRAEGWFEVSETTQGVAVNKAMQKVGGFAANELSRTIQVNPLGNESASVATIDLDSRKVTQTSTQAGIGNSAVAISRAGVTQALTGFSGGDPALYAYDGWGRQIGATDPATGNTTIAQYDPVFGQLASVALLGQLTQNTYYGTNEEHPGLLKASSVNGLTTYYDYDALGHNQHTWGPAAYPLWWEYDANGRKSRLHTFRSGTELEWSDRQWFIQAGEGDVTSWHYWPATSQLEQKLDSASRGTRYTYTSGGELATRIWARGVLTTYTYNGAAEIKGISYSDSTPTVAYTYDNSGRQAIVVDGGGTHIRSFDSVGQEQNETVSGNTGVLVGFGFQVAQDSFGRPMNLQCTKAGTPILGTRGQSYAYEPSTGRLSTAEDDESIATYIYQPNSSKLQKKVISSPGVPENLTVTNTYDSAGRMQSISSGLRGVLLDSHNYSYDAAGHRTRDDLADGTYWGYDFNSRSELTGGVRYGIDGRKFLGQQFGYSYDFAGNRQQSATNGRQALYSANASDQYQSRQVPAFVDILGSASLNAVVRVTGPQGAVVAPRQGNMFAATVPVDNRASPQNAGISVSAEVPNTLNDETLATSAGKVFVAKNPEPFSYDQDGNLITDGRWTYGWNGENQLATMQTNQDAISAGGERVQLTFTYDSRHRRIAKSVQAWVNGSWVSRRSLTYLYDEGCNLLVEADLAKTQSDWSRYLWGIDLMGGRTNPGGIGGLVSQTVGSKTYLPLYDALGNVCTLVDSSGLSSVNTFSYGPYGEPIRSTRSSNSEFPFGFSTKYTDEESGDLVFVRPYSPSLGRWLSRDQSSEDGCINLYSYCLNQPNRMVDVEGFNPELPEVPNYVHIDPGDANAAGAGAGYTKSLPGQWIANTTDVLPCPFVGSLPCSFGFQVRDKSLSLIFAPKNDAYSPVHETQHVRDLVGEFDGWIAKINFLGKCAPKNKVTCRKDVADGDDLKMIYYYRFLLLGLELDLNQRPNMPGGNHSGPRVELDRAERNLYTQKLNSLLIKVEAHLHTCDQL